jgi:hypothetical protein
MADATPVFFGLSSKIKRHKQITAMSVFESLRAKTGARIHSRSELKRGLSNISGLCTMQEFQDSFIEHASKDRAPLN